MNTHCRQVCSVLMTFVLAIPMLAFGAPKFSKGTSADGVIAWQDASDPSQFYYMPGRIDTVLGQNLKAFKAEYWGIGPAHWAQDSSGTIYSITGAILSGSANLDVTQAQRDSIKAELAKTFGVASPKLLPLPMRNVHVTPILDAQTLALGAQDVTLSFPTTYQFGTDLIYSIGTGNSLFAQVVGARDAQNSDVHPNPTFGVSIIGDSEFVGDPWTSEVKCDLSQVWDQVRSRVSVSVSYGWFRLGSADYQDIRQSLERTGACTFKMDEGSLDNEKYGRQIFEMMKTIFEAINKLATEGDGFFKLEPNPQAGDPGGGGASSWAPWSVSVNGGYSHAYFKQTVTYSNTISYTGRFNYTIPTSMILAVNCNNATKAFFVDLGNAAEPCITQAKIDTFNSRMQCEAKARQPKLEALAERYALGSITQAQYDRLLALYNRTSFCESFVPTDASKPRAAAVKPLPLKSLKSWAVQHISDAQLKRMEEKVLAKP